MSTQQLLKIDDLNIDLHNFRTVPQKDEVSAIRTMIAIAPNKFWGLMESILTDGYLPIENVVVLKAEKTGELVVREGNRRVGCLKLIHGLIRDESIDLPQHIQDAIKGKDASWLGINQRVPALVYPEKDELAVDRIVTLTHGKSQTAGRDAWEAIARARHSRDKEGKSETGLDLFEKYLSRAKNFTEEQAERWSGTFNLSVLDEAIKRASSRFGAKSSRELADKYPKISHLKALNELIKDIGNEAVGFKEVRNDSEDLFSTKYGMPAIPLSTSGGAGTGSGAGGGGGTSGAAGSGSGGTKRKGGGRGAGKTPPLDDPRSVRKLLSTFHPRGRDQHKLATLTVELKLLPLPKTPHAFCFVLRSLFDIAGKQFADLHKIPLTDKVSGKERKLAAILQDTVKELTKGKAKTDPLCRRLYGASQVLASPNGILSVTSMNQLIHNPKFSAKPGDICSVFHNVFPLLQELTK